LYVLLGQRCPLPCQLYRQKAVYQQEGVAFESKIEMATHQIGTFKTVAGTQTCQRQLEMDIATIRNAHEKAHENNRVNEDLRLSKADCCA